MELNSLKDRLEQMEKTHQIEVLRIINKMSSFKMNENNNGTFINLTEQPIELINALEKYANYVDEQQRQLKKGEIEKEQMEQHFFNS